MKMVIAFLFLVFFAFFAAAVEAQQGQNVNEESNLPQDKSRQMTLYQTAANTPGLMSYIGHLADAAGNPITTSTSVSFSIYALATGGTALWSETHNITPSSTGTFGVALGSITPISSKLFKDNSNLYLGVKVANDAEMTPRQMITSAAFAFSAEVASPREGYGAPVAIGTANASGAATTLARSDHVHQGVRSLSRFGGSSLYGDVTLSAGINTILTQTGQNLEVSVPSTAFARIGKAGSPTLTGDVALEAGTNITLSQSGQTITISSSSSSSGGTFTQGSIIFAGASGVFSQNNSNLFWDNTNNRFGIGTSSPGDNLHIDGGNATQANLRISGSGTESQIRLYNGATGGHNWAIASTGGSSAVGQGRLSIYDETANSPRLRIDASGNVIIGTPTTLFAKLHVEGDLGSVGKSGTYAFLKFDGNFDNAENGVSTQLAANNGGLNEDNNNNSGNSIFGSGRITTGTEFNAFSDARIKNILGVSSGAADLNALRQIEVVDFRYKDRRKDDGPKKKVIGQQLAKVYPQAVHFMTAEIADIMRDATVNGRVITLPDHGLKTGDRVKLIFEEGDIEKVYTVLSITPDTFTVDENKQGGVFVYGKEVDDFHIVDYEAIGMLNVSATQELANIIAVQQRQIESLQAEIKAIRESLTSASEAVGLRK